MKNRVLFPDRKVALFEDGNVTPPSPKNCKYSQANEVGNMHMKMAKGLLLFSFMAQHYESLRV